MKVNQSGFTGARDSEWQWHQLGHMQICTLPQHATTQFFTGRMPFLPPNHSVTAFTNEQTDPQTTTYSIDNIDLSWLIYASL